jgi:hypothetical protein
VQEKLRKTALFIDSIAISVGGGLYSEKA